MTSMQGFFLFYGIITALVLISVVAVLCIDKLGSKKSGNETKATDKTPYAPETIYKINLTAQ